LTEEEFNRLFPSGEQEQPATPSAQQPAQTQEQDLEFDPQATAELLGSLVEQPEGGPTQPSTRAASGITPEQIQRARSSGVLGAISDAISPPDAVDAFTSGGMRAVFETKDFLFGDTLPEEQSSVRRGIELQNDQLKEEAPIINGLSSGIGQFAVAMIGIGKLGKVAQAIPKVGEALRAFTRNDGLLTPHNSSELRGDVSTAWQVPGTQAFGKGYFRPFDSFGNIFYNAISIPLSAAGAGPRVLGTVDELVKQTVYRSKVAARAHMEGVEHAVEQGLSGKAYKEYIKRHVEKRLDDAFDAEGRGLDAEALREANIATFQQELMPGTLGKAVQGFVSNESSQFTRLVLPFVKTPTNVIRYAWKLTPALNLLQGEYRQMFSGAMGHEAKAQAVGQMAMGTLFMGAAGALAFSGMITGGGPSNPRLKQQLLATGWQPYSIVTENEDGTKTYTPFNRYDPIALPFGIIADIQDALHVAQQSGDEELEDNIQTAMTGLAIGLAKQFTSRSYLLSLNQALEALSDPERSGKVFVGGVAQSMVPFSAATRQLSQDSYMRDARTVTDKMLQVVPGMSETLPPKFNWLGQLILNRQGLWSDDNGTLVDIETVRLGLEGSSVMGPPSYTMGFKGSEVDLRDITLTTGENAYIKLQELSGKPGPNAMPLRDVIAKVMASPAYQRAPDGSIETPLTRPWMLARVVSKYRTAAAKRIQQDANVREGLLKAQRKVKDHFAHLKAEPTDEQRGGLQAVLEAFGAGD